MMNFMIPVFSTSWINVPHYFNANHSTVDAGILGIRKDWWNKVHHLLARIQQEKHLKKV